MSSVTDPTLRFLRARIGRLTSYLNRGKKLSPDEWDELSSCRAQVRRIEQSYYPDETRLLGRSSEPTT